MTRETAFRAELIPTRVYPQEVSRVSFPLHLRAFTRTHLSRRLHQAYASGALQWIKRLHALLALAQGQSVRDVAQLLALGAPTGRDDRQPYLCKGLASLVSTAPPGRPSPRTHTPRQPRAQGSKASPQDSGDPSGCGHTPLLHDLMQRHLSVVYHPHASATWLKPRGFSSHKARVVSEQLREAKRLAWRQSRGPKMLRHAQQRKALRLFGAEASVAPWGSVRSPGAPTGHPPEVPTSGTRKAYKVCGRIASCSGRLFYTAHAGRCNSQSAAAFWREVWSQTPQPIVGIHEGARDHTSKALAAFVKMHEERGTMEQLPAYAPAFNPLAHLGQKVKKAATHLNHLPACTNWPQEVDSAWLHVAHTPRAIPMLMARDGDKLGKVDQAA